MNNSKALIVLILMLAISFSSIGQIDTLIRVNDYKGVLFKEIQISNKKMSLIFYDINGEAVPAKFLVDVNSADKEKLVALVKEVLNKDNCGENSINLFITSLDSSVSEIRLINQTYENYTNLEIESLLNEVIINSKLNCSNCSFEFCYSEYIFCPIDRAKKEIPKIKE